MNADHIHIMSIVLNRRHVITISPPNRIGAHLETSDSEVNEIVSDHACDRNRPP